MISLLNPSSWEPKFGRLWSVRPESKLFETAHRMFLHNSQIFISFFTFLVFAKVIYIAVVITLTTHSFVCKLSVQVTGSFFSPRVKRSPSTFLVFFLNGRDLSTPADLVGELLHFGSSSRESVRGSIVAAGPRSGCFKRFIVFFKACRLLQNQTRTTSLS